MTEADRPRVSVRCARLSSVIRWDHFRLDGTEVEQIRELYGAVRDGFGSFANLTLEAPEADADRWFRATADLVGATEQAWTEQNRAEARLRPPSSAGRWLAWRARGGRTDRVRQEVEATVERLRSEVLAAYLAFRDRAADLTDRIDADQARRREEYAREWQQRQAARGRALAEISEAPVWSYQVGPNHGSTDPRRQRLVITLQLLEQQPNPTLGDPVSGLTAARVNEAIERLRADDPYLVVHLDPATREKLVEWTEEQLLEAQWLRVSGVKIDPHPLTPEELEEIRNRPPTNTWHGPSSNYFSPPSF